MKILPVQSELFDTYVKSLYDRENALRHLSTMSNKDTSNDWATFWYSHRSFIQNKRIDLVHMALVCQVYRTGKIQITHPESNRAILGMEDLMQAVTDFN